MQKLSLSTSHKLTNVQPVLNSGYFEKQYLPVPTSKLLLLVREWYRISLWLVLVCSPGCDPCHLSAYPQPVHWGREHSEKQKVLVLFEHCSAIAKMLLCNQHHFDQKSKTSMEIAMKNINSSSARPSKRSSVLIGLIFASNCVYNKNKEFSP